MERKEEVGDLTNEMLPQMTCRYWRSGAISASDCTGVKRSRCERATRVR